MYIVTIVERAPTRRSNYDLVTNSVEVDSIFEAVKVIENAGLNSTLFESVTITTTRSEAQNART